MRISSANSPLGMILTLAVVIGGLYIGYKHYKGEGFWWGVLALFLISSSIFISSRPTTTIV